MRPGALFLLLLLHLQPAHSSPPATTPEPLSLDPGTLPWLASEPRGRTLTLLEAAAAVSDPEERVVVLISLTAGVKRYVLNLIASLTMHNVTAVAVLCYESRALQLCEALGFPACVDARACLPPGSPPIRNSEVGLERDEAAALYWGRHICALRLLREGYNVVGTDADAVAFSDLVRQFRQGVYLTGASAVFASEPSFSTEGQWPGRTGYINMINSGWCGQCGQSVQLAYSALLRARPFNKAREQCCLCSTVAAAAALAHPPLLFRSLLGTTQRHWRSLCSRNGPGTTPVSPEDTAPGHWTSGGRTTRAL